MMTFDNKKTTFRIYIGQMILASITVLLLTSIMVSGWFEKDILGISKYQWVILVTLVYLILIILLRLRQLNYFYFSDEGDKILIRYHPIHPLVRKKKAVQIPKIGLSGYEIKRTMLGLRTVLIINQKVKGKIAKYPPIGISSLMSKECDLLRKQLDKYVRS
ncbi:hypothetical protein ACFLR8_02140 [Bacteroidota bacterium]